MLPQTLPIRFLLNHRSVTAPSHGAAGPHGPNREVWAGGADWGDWAHGPGASESEPTPLRKLEGLARALGLKTLWFKEGYGGGTKKPAELKEAYTVLARETLAGLEGGPLPTHIFLQAGTGDLAATVARYFSFTLGEKTPRVVVVEPANADCVLESALASQPTPDSGGMETNMGFLACREISWFAWTVLKDAADAFLSISDYAAEATVRLLEEGVAKDSSILTRPSGAAGLAGLIAASFEPALTGPLELGPESRVLVIGWDGPA